MSERAALTLKFRDHQRPRMERFWDFVFPEPNTGCWLYAGDDNGHGYGVFNIGGYRVRYAHRLSYEAIVGAIPSGLQIDHLCRVRCCVNPDHLDVVTASENMRRAAAHIVYPNAVKTHCANGHPFEGNNLILKIRNGRQRRVCRACMKMHYRSYRARKAMRP